MLVGTECVEIQHTDSAHSTDTMFMENADSDDGLWISDGDCGSDPESEKPPNLIRVRSVKLQSPCLRQTDMGGYTANVQWEY